MSVNTMEIEQASTVLASLVGQATGTTVKTPANLSEYISLGNTALRVGYDKILNAISQTLERTIFSVRPYNRRFGGLEVTPAQFGAITRKINFADQGPQTAANWELTDGQSVDPFVVKKADILETHFYGSDVYEGQSPTIFKNQLDICFKDPAEMARFYSALATHFANERELWIENIIRAALSNFVAAKSTYQGSAINLLDEYNTYAGTQLTTTTVQAPANFPSFVRWATARIKEVSRMMQSKSTLYQAPITGKNITRHTPVEDQKIYMLANFLGHVEAEVFPDAYHDEYLKLSDYETVDFWQSIEDPSAIDVTAGLIDADGAVTSQAVSLDNVIGTIFDRDALFYTLYDNSLEPSIYNPKGSYWNIFAHTRIRIANDLTEKGVVFTIEDAR